MRLTPSDPDIETLLRRIDVGSIDLQPDFQRGEVWGEQKQNRLIDTILRNWYIPPIHLIEHPGSEVLEVLDGQQRLVAIRNFFHGEFHFYGRQEPRLGDLEQIHGLSFQFLPERLKLRFLRFPIRLYTIHGFEPGEPAELFFRLNQQVALTAAEQRNAFFGPVRDQVHALVKKLDLPPLGKQGLGFSNSRMAYDDVIARTCLTLEAGTLHSKISAASLAERYRSKKVFSAPVENLVDSAISTLGSSVVSIVPIRFNKPILYSWLVFIASLTRIGCRDFSGELSRMAKLYDELTTKDDISGLREIVKPVMGGGWIRNAELLARATWMYSDRATSRVSDVSSVVWRDIYLWLLFYCILKQTGSREILEVKQLHFFESLHRLPENLTNSTLENIVSEAHWDL